MIKNWKGYEITGLVLVNLPQNLVANTIYVYVFGGETSSSAFKIVSEAPHRQFPDMSAWKWMRNSEDWTADSDVRKLRKGGANCVVPHARTTESDSPGIGFQSLPFLILP